MPETQVCPKCSGPLDRMDMHCPFCGAVFSQSAPVAPEMPPSAPPANPAYQSAMATPLVIPGPGELPPLGLKPPAASPAPVVPVPPAPVPAPAPVAPAPVVPVALQVSSPAPQPAPAPTVPALPNPAMPQAPRAPGPAANSANPYRAPRAPVQRAEFHSPLEGLIPASRWNRLMAVIVDGLAFVVPLLVLMVIGITVQQPTEEDMETLVWTLLAIVGIPVALVNMYLLGQSGQSIGKRVLGIRIVRMSGEPVSLGRIIILRHLVMSLVGWIPFIGSVMGLLDALFIFGDARRCIHDYLADTQVVVA